MVDALFMMLSLLCGVGIGYELRVIIKKDYHRGFTDGWDSAEEIWRKE